MTLPSSDKGRDLRAAARLATEATEGLARLVEAMHERIARLPGLGPPLDGRTDGITGGVYRTIHAITRATGGGVDALLGLIGPALGAYEHERERDAIVAALNGVLGDHLEARGNPLATPMTLRHRGRPLVMQRAALADALPAARGRLLVLVHGLCMNDWQWERHGHDHGAALARDQGWTPVSLRYNSGRHISTNGREFAELMEQLVDAWPQPLDRIAIVAHSMGGLVTRSALHHAEQASLRWRNRLGDLVCLGTPHHGAPLERAGHWIDLLLAATPYAAPLARLARVRSAGVTDLRHGVLLDEDWAGRDRFGRGGSPPRHVPLPQGLRCHALAASLGMQPGGPTARLLGDGLVPVDSALGRHARAELSLAFAAERQWVGQAMNHMDLLDHPAVYARLSQSLAGS